MNGHFKKSHCTVIACCYRAASPYLLGTGPRSGRIRSSLLEGQGLTTVTNLHQNNGEFLKTNASKLSPTSNAPPELKIMCSSFVSYNGWRFMLLTVSCIARRLNPNHEPSVKIFELNRNFYYFWERINLSNKVRYSFRQIPCLEVKFENTNGATIRCLYRNESNMIMNLFSLQLIWRLVKLKN